MVLAPPPLFVCVLVPTNPLHHLMRKNLDFSSAKQSLLFQILSAKSMKNSVQKIPFLEKLCMMN